MAASTLFKKTAPADAPPKSVRSERSRQRAFAGAMLVTAVLFGALGLVVFQQAAGTTQVLVTTALIQQGSRILPADLKAEAVHLPAGSTTIGGSFLPSMGRYYASTTIEPGSLLVRSDIGTTALVPVGHALVGAVFSTVQTPYGLQSGEVVDLVYTGSSSTHATAGPSLVPGAVICQAKIWSIVQPSSSGGGAFGSSSSASTPTGPRTVELLVPTAIAPSVALAASGNTLAVATIKAN